LSLINDALNRARAEAARREAGERVEAPAPVARRDRSFHLAPVAWAAAAVLGLALVLWLWRSTSGELVASTAPAGREISSQGLPSGELPGVRTPGAAGHAEPPTAPEPGASEEPTSRPIASEPAALGEGAARAGSDSPAAVEEATLATLPEPAPPPPPAEPVPATTEVKPLLVVGALRSVERSPRYDQAYFEIAYPGGDLPPDRGAAIDVVVRAFRHAGVDLQEAVQRDILDAPAAYGIEEPDPSIDHRRIRYLVTFFERRATSLSTGPDGDWAAGDIVFWDRNGAGAAGHLGILTDEIGPSGKPLVVHHHRPDGEFPGTPEAGDVLLRWPVVGHYRWSFKAAPEGPPADPGRAAAAEPASTRIASEPAESATSAARAPAPSYLEEQSSAGADRSAMTADAAPRDSPATGPAVVWPADSAGAETWYYVGEVALPGGGLIELGGIAWSAAAPSAMLNGSLLGVGDEVLGLEVTAIDPRTVTLTGHGQRISLQLGPASRP